MKGQLPPRLWPKLSETLPHERKPNTCQACGEVDGDVKLWLEHDEADRPTRTLVVLCDSCSKALIEPHPRLYHGLPSNKPVPGAMPHLCYDCKHRNGLDCRHPKLKANGGPGLNIAVAEPMRGFWDGRGKGGRRTGGMMEIWPSRAQRCEGRES